MPKQWKTWKWFLGWMLAGLLAAWSLSAPIPPPETSGATPAPLTLTVSAAADLSYAFPEIGQLWEQETGNKVIFNFGSTGQLAQQIERGAPVDVFAAANRSFVEQLDRARLVFSDTKALYGIGRLTIWQRQGSSVVVNALKDLLKPEVKRVAIANPDHAPYGVAAREALQSAGLWEALQPKLVLGENVKQAQQYAETGNVEVALVPLSISVEKPGQWTLIPETMHKPLEQMLAVPKNAPHPEAARHFATFINSEQGRPIMQKYGFILPEEKPTP
ncbi:MAG: molybdate ABC transporter substrate-binding protein [Cyanobacteriota bacterium]